MARGFWMSFWWDSSGLGMKAPFREGGGIQKGGFFYKARKILQSPDFWAPQKTGLALNVVYILVRQK